jgi:hypothetical protein
VCNRLRALRVRGSRRSELREDRLTQQCVRRVRRFKIHHVPGVRDVDPLRTGNAPREQIGHRQETRHVELADDNGCGRAPICSSMAIGSGSVRAWGSSCVQWNPEYGSTSAARRRASCASRHAGGWSSPRRDVPGRDYHAHRGHAEQP